MPRVFPLRTDNLPDIGDHLVHFTGRTGGRFAVPGDIRNLTYPDRLAQILYQGRIRAVPTFGTGGRPIVAFTKARRPRSTVDQRRAASNEAVSSFPELSHI